MTRAFDPAALSLYLVLDPGLCAGPGLVETARAAVRGGATMIQLRDKDATTEARIAAGRALRAALDGSGVPLILNDDVEAAVAVGADGVHIGQDDMTPAEARARIGAAAILGLSVETEALGRAIDGGTVDYAGAGPVFATDTKPGHKPAIGFDGLARIVAASPVPAVAIGGLGARHAARVHAAGARGLAVVSAICGAPDPEAAAREIAKSLSEAREGAA
jgi:thiamine-phosphate pyrophosphorylase